MSTTPPSSPATLTGQPARWRDWLAAFVPMPVAASSRERIKSCLGAFLALGCTEWISRHLLGGFNPWFIAPMGASAVLLFAVPSSPLAQPWSVIGGNLLAAVIGVACARWIPDPGVAAALAVALSIGLMFRLHCLHPPAGAIAITAVFGGTAVTKLGFGFVVMPVAVNSMLMLLLALAFNNLVGRRYPHRHHAPPASHGTSDPPPSERIGVTRADLDAVLAARGEYLDIERDDLEEILVAAGQRAYRRHFGDVRCGEIMSRDMVTIGADQRVGDAWALLRRHRLHALPVVSPRQRQLVGIVSMTDLLIGDPGRGERRRDGIVRDVMLTDVPSASADQPIVELAAAMSDGGWHLMPVVDDHKRLIGLISQSDLLAALLKPGAQAVSR